MTKINEDGTVTVHLYKDYKKQYGKTLLEAVEKMLEYLLDNKLLGQ